MKKTIVTAIAITGLAAVVFGCAQAAPTGTPAAAPPPQRAYEEVDAMGILVGQVPSEEGQLAPVEYSQPQTFTQRAFVAGAIGRSQDDIRLERLIQETTNHINEYISVGYPPPHEVIDTLVQLEEERIQSTTAAVASVEAPKGTADEALIDELIGATQRQIDFCVTMGQPVPEFMTGAMKQLEEVRKALRALDEERRAAVNVMGLKIMAGEASASDLAADLQKIEAARQAILKSVGSAD
ncbi:MAG: hypothetical protein A2147_03750 [Chloroflexi bacterium RBG_16_57_8]|nr:MAG: hypothetical protein A2147_03750 [Chloroflexi bacterium RBG_16_57_8]